MTEHKELAKDFVIAMIQRGYFDNPESNEARADAILKAYKQFETVLSARSINKEIQKEATLIRQGL